MLFESGREDGNEKFGTSDKMLQTVGEEATGENLQFDLIKCHRCLDYLKAR